MPDLVPFRIYSNRTEAQLAKTFLASHGIDAAISFETICDMQPFFKPANGIQLLIRKEDLEEVEALFKSVAV